MPKLAVNPRKRITKKTIKTSAWLTGSKLVKTQIGPVDENITYFKMRLKKDHATALHDT